MFDLIRRLAGAWTALFLGAAALAPGRADAQGCYNFTGCPEQNIHGSITAADSTPFPGFCALVFVCSSPQWCNAMTTDWNNSTARGWQPGQGQTVDLTFYARADYYYQTPYGGAATCRNDDGDACGECEGNFSFQLHAQYGNFEGRVIKLPSGEPGVGLAVAANHGACGAYADASVTAADGTYDFARQRGPLWDANNWGVFLKPIQVASAPVTEDYTLSVCGSCAKVGRSSSTTSSQSTPLDLTCWTDPEDPGIRPPIPPPPAPGPTCDPGKPVNAPTGNMYFDQTDAVVPGVAAGGLRFSRSYNSANAVDATRYGMFGPGWFHPYEKRITDQGTVLKLRDADGVPRFFRFDHNEGGDAIYVASVPFTSESTIRKRADGTFAHEFRRGGSEQYAASPSGRLTGIVDPSGNVTTLTYDQNRLAAITDPSQRQLTLEYPDATTVRLSGPAGLIATYTLESAGGPLASVEYADGDGDGSPDGSYDFTYQPGPGARRLLTVSDGSGRVIETHEYDVTGRATTSEISGGIEKLTFDYSQPLKTLVTDARGNLTTYDYTNIWGLKLVTKIAGSCDSSGNTTREWGYDSKGRITSHRDGEGNVTAYTYDSVTGDLLSEGRAVQTGGPVTHTTGYTYYPDGRIHTRTEPNGGVTTFVYGPAGPTSITRQVTPTQNRVTSIQYTPQGKPQFVTDPKGNQWELSHNSTGDLEWMKDPTPARNQTSYVYDLMGRLRQVVRPPVAGDPPILEPVTTYDVLGRVKRVTNPDGTFTEMLYDGGGRQTRVTDPAGRVTELEYDPFGRLELVRDARMGETEYGYDDVSNLTSITDARDKKTMLEFDDLNRVWKVCYHSTSSECTRFDEFTYDDSGRVETRRDRRGITTTYAYDGLGRLTSKAYTDGTPAASFVYDQGGADQKGRLTSAVSSPINLGWSYDLAGQIRTATRTRPPLSSYTISYAYDAAGNREQLTLNGQPLATYDWEERNLIETITRLPQNRTYSFGYDAAGRRKTLTFPNTVVTTYGYDNRSRLGSITAVAGPTTVTNLTYPLHDPLGNRLNRGGSTAPAEGYAYDELYRLLDVSRELQVPEAYSYDAVGNRLSSLTVPVWTYDDWNELTLNSAASFKYDANGNLTDKVEGGFTWTYEWDAEDRLKRTRKNGVNVATYIYDALGRRAERNLPGGGAGQHTYVYDGEDILRVGSGGGIDQLKTLYVHGPGIDEPLESQNLSGQVAFHHTDGLGSIVRTTNSQAAVTLTRQYDAFGNPELGGTQAGYAFTGREWDPESGLYYYRARYYDPKIGRFISEDPLPITVRRSEELNNYVYVTNSPTNYIDPAGLCVVLGKIPFFVDPFLIGGRQLPVHRLTAGQRHNPATRMPRATQPRPYTSEQQPLPPPPVPTPDQIVPRMPWWIRLLKSLDPWMDEAPAVPACEQCPTGNWPYGMTFDECYKAGLCA